MKKSELDGKNPPISKGNYAWLEKQPGQCADRPTVLIAEDSEADIYFLSRVLSQARVTNPICVTVDGRETLAYLEGSGKYSNRTEFPIPGIVLLDLHMPAPDGFEILRWRQSQPHLDDVLFVALSNSDAIEDINRAYTLGADTFLTKPINVLDLKNLIGAFEARWGLKMRHPVVA